MDRIIKSESLSMQNTLKPHCFPDISVGYSPNNIEDKKENGFQRIGFVEIKKPSPVPPKVSPKNEKSVDEIKQKVSDIEKQAYIQGFAKGEKAGMESGKNKFKPVLNNFCQVFLELEKVKKEICMNAEKKTVDLALAIAKKIVCYEIATNKEVVLNVVKEAIKKVMDHGKIVIKISSSDLQFIKNFDSGFLNFVDNIEDITFEENGTISDGGCVIKTDFGDIDARIEELFQAVDEAFKCQGLMRGVIAEKRKTVSGSGRDI